MKALHLILCVYFGLTFKNQSATFISNLSGFLPAAPQLGNVEVSVVIVSFGHTQVVILVGDFLFLLMFLNY